MLSPMLSSSLPCVSVLAPQLFQSQNDLDQNAEWIEISDPILTTLLMAENKVDVKNCMA